MAEERFIDDDLNKDKKYKIRKNADGEDELYIDESAEDAQEGEEFEMPVFAYDDEEAAVMTPEQLAAREQAKIDERERIQTRLSELISKAKEQLAVPDYEGALYSLNLAEELDGQNGETLMLKMLALSRNFTDYTLFDDCVRVAESVRDFCTEEQKKELEKVSAPLVERIEKMEENVAALHVENESKKNERRAVFIEKRKHALIFFSLTALPFLLFLTLALSYSTVMFAVRDGRNITLTIVFAALAAVAFIASLFTGHKLWESQRQISLNEKNSSTQLGRDYENALSELETYRGVLTSFSEI